MFQDLCSTGNKTGLQPVSRPVEKILGFFLKGLSATMCSEMFKKLMAPKLYKVRRLRHRQTCFQTSGHRIGEIWPDFYVVWTLFPGFWGQGVHFWGQKNVKRRKLS